MTRKCYPGFSPLPGIDVLQTRHIMSALSRASPVSVPLRGLMSLKPNRSRNTTPIGSTSFSPLTRIDVPQTKRIRRRNMAKRKVSVPLRGLMSLRHENKADYAKALIDKSQSPYEDCTSSRGPGAIAGALAPPLILPRLGPIDHGTGGDAYCLAASLLPEERRLQVGSPPPIRLLRPRRRVRPLPCLELSSVPLRGLMSLMTKIDAYVQVVRGKFQSPCED